MIKNNKIKFNLINFEDIFKENKKSKMKASEGEKFGDYKFFNCSKTQKLFSNKYLTEESLLISTGGTAAVHYCGEPHAYSTDVWSIKSKNTKYMYYYYNSIIHKIEDCFQGAGLKHLSKKNFKKIEIKIPDEKTQKNIIDYLDKKLFNINSIKKLLEKIEIRNQYYADKLLSGELSIDEEGKISENKSLLENFKLEDIVERKITAGTTPASISTTGDVFFYKINNIKNGKIVEPKLFISFSDNEKYNRSSIIEGDILFSIAGTLGSVAYITKENTPANTNQNIAIIRIDKKNNKKYVFYFLKNLKSDIDSIVKGGGIKSINSSGLSSLIIKLPNINVQNDIVKFLDKLEDEKSKVERLLELEEKRFKWLSDKLLSGEYIIED